MTRREGPSREAGRRCGANSHGYLDRDFPFEKQAGVRRAVVIGDSIAQGDGVAPGESFGKVLEALLNASWVPSGEKATVWFLSVV